MVFPSLGLSVLLWQMKGLDSMISKFFPAYVPEDSLVDLRGRLQIELPLFSPGVPDPVLSP